MLPVIGILRYIVERSQTIRCTVGTLGSFRGRHRISRDWRSSLYRPSVVAADQLRLSRPWVMAGGDHSGIDLSQLKVRPIH